MVAKGVCCNNRCADIVDVIERVIRSQMDLLVIGLKRCLNDSRYEHFISDFRWYKIGVR